MTYSPGGKIDAKESVKTGTTTALATNTRSGNVLTASANGALGTIGATTMALGDRVLVKNEADPVKHGIYYVSDLGSAGTPWKLTRARDADQQGKMTSSMMVTVEQGTLADQVWQLTTNSPITINTTGLTFTRFSDLSLHATLASPVLTGTPTVPTASQGTNTTQAASTAFVQTADGLLIPKSLVDAKGDMLIGSANDTVVRHAAGANGTIPVFDSAQSDGINNRVVAAASPALVMHATGYIPGGAGSGQFLIGSGKRLYRYGDTGFTQEHVSLLFWTTAAFSITGWNQEIMVVATMATNGTDPNSDFTFFLNPTTGGGGGAGIVYLTDDGAPVATTSSINPSPGQTATTNSGWVAAPATNQQYALIAESSANPAANSHNLVSVSVFSRYVN